MSARANGAAFFLPSAPVEHPLADATPREEVRECEHCDSTGNHGNIMLYRICENCSRVICPECDSGNCPHCPEAKP